jgi:hypothetical protein
MKKIMATLVALFAFASTSAYTQTLPSGSLGTVTGNTRNTWQPFTYTFTPSTSGANFVGFAFREDPAFWTFDNVTLTAAGSTTNLLTNGTFTTGGRFSVTTNNGVSNMQAPTNWGVWYQNGTYPAAAGTWTDNGGAHGGVWYDGAVGSFDGIYQGVALTAGTTYTIAFEVSGNNTSNGSSIQLGIYGGACATVSISPDQCTIPSTVGFTTLATPSQGAAAGNPTPPPVTLTSTTNLAATATSSTAYGTAVTTNRVVDTGANDGRWIRVNRATTPLTNRPFTTTTVTTPHTLETYSDNTTVTTNGTPVTTTTVGSTLTVGQTAVQSQSVSATATRDAIRARNINPFLVDPLSTKDGVWATPFYRSTRSDGNVTAQGASAGWQNTVDNNSFGFALSGDRGSVNGLPGSTSNIDSYSGSVYVLIRDDVLWYKASVGYGRSNYSTKTEIPTFALVNSSRIRQNNIYADLGVYSAETFADFRPFAGVIINRSEVSGVESGSLLLSTLPANSTETKIMPYIGTRYELSKEFALEFRAIQTPDYKTVLSNRGVVSGNITEDISVNATIGFDKSLKEKYNNFYGMVGLKVSF